MKLTPEQILKIAQLARLELSPEEVERYTSQLTTILDYVDMLGELDLSSVKETSQVTGLSSVTRPDELSEPLCTPDELLETSPLPQEDHQIRVKRVI